MSHSTQKMNPFYIDEEYWSEEEKEEYYDDEYKGLVSTSGTRPAATDMYKQHYHEGDRVPLVAPGLKWAASVVLLFMMFIILTSQDNGDGNQEPRVGGNQAVGDDMQNEKSKNHKPSSSIVNLVVIGERHSGVDWMYTKLQSCYPKIHLSQSLQRQGTFFQNDPELPKRSSTNTEMTEVDTLVVHMVLNVYDWLEQVRLFPMYMPAHQAAARDEESGHVMPLPWEDFVSRPWTLPERPDRDHGLEDGHGLRFCQEDFAYHRVMSCKKAEDAVPEESPIYELQSDGTAFANILDMRAAKLRHFHEDLANHEDYVTTVDQVMTVQHDTLRRTFGDLLDGVEAATGWERSCSSNILPPNLMQREQMTKEFVEYLAEHVDWTVEKMMGYEPWSNLEMAKYNIQSSVIDDEISTVAPTTTIQDEKLKPIQNKNETTIIKHYASGDEEEGKHGKHSVHGQVEHERPQIDDIMDDP